jgi:ribonuclease J
MAEITIHRGTNAIGGSCIEIKSGKTRIIFDLGKPLMENGGGEIDENNLNNPSIENKILPNLKGLYKNDKPDIEAVFISHAHHDHCGLLNRINPEIPVYMSRGTRLLIETGNVFYPESLKVHIKNIKNFEHWKPVEIGPFKITSYLADHSGFDASSFLIEVENKKIFYSGDFRGHGRKSVLLDNFEKHPFKNIDCLIMEGTTLGNNHNTGYASEADIEKGLYQWFSIQRDIGFIQAAGSNIDRIVSIYRACLKSKKIFVMDLYTYYILTQLKQVSPSLPPHKNDNIRIYYIRGHCCPIAENLGSSFLYENKHRKIELDEIMAKRDDIVLRLPLKTADTIAEELAAQQKLNRSLFIFSMWKGYLDKDASYEAFCKKYSLMMRNIHVSGHAYLKDLKRFCKALKAKKIIPVHTLQGEMFSDLFDNVYRYEDGVTFEI